MDQKELLEALSGLTGRYEQHRSYIEKARAQLASGKFNAAVVEKVIFDHETKAALVVDEARPLLPRFHARVSELEADKSSVHASKGGVDEQVQELELRNAIGELSDADFEKAVGDMRETVNTANARIAVIDSDLSTLSSAVERWTALVGPDNVPAAPVPAASAPPTATAQAQAEPVGAHVNLTDIVDELFDTGTSSAPVVEEEIAIEASEAVDDGGSGGPSLDIDFSLDADADIDLGKAAPIESSPVESSPVEAAPVDVAAVDAAPAADEPLRRALLLYREGTAEEQIYPFTGDILTIGRGRPPADGSDRHIQIKNDSKVSRIHCSLYRRGNNFYIEDGHIDETGQHKPSANNTFVNEEVVRERRLFGGELISVGDPDQTYFRFRIME